MKKSLKILLLGCLVVTAAAMSAAAVKSISAEPANNTPTVKAEYTPTQEGEYCLRDWQGYVAVFHGGDDTPTQLTDIETATLNNVDREKLREGIPASGKAELLSLLEDFSS